jgi:quinol monooxygenase YgiN
MIAILVRFEVKDEVKKQLANREVARKHLQEVIEGCRKVPGMLQKYFIMDPDTCAQGALLLFDTRENFEKYSKTEMFKQTVYDICVGKPRIEFYEHTGNLKDGVFI